MSDAMYKTALHVHREIKRSERVSEVGVVEVCQKRGGEGGGVGQTCLKREGEVDVRRVRADGRVPKEGVGKKDARRGRDGSWKREGGGKGAERGGARTGVPKGRKGCKKEGAYVG